MASPFSGPAITQFSLKNQLNVLVKQSTAFRHCSESRLQRRTEDPTLAAGEEPTHRAVARDANDDAAPNFRMLYPLAGFEIGGAWASR